MSKKIAIYGMEFNESFIPHIKKLFELLNKANAHLLIFEPFSRVLNTKIGLSENISLFNKKDQLKEVDILLSIGGDGTLLNTINLVREHNIPVLGINTGRLGFLSNVSKNDIESAVSSIISGNYQIEQRTLLSLETSTNLFGENNYALNELTIHKKDTASMITIHAYINDEYLNTYWADGLIVSTPTGSTAYSLSCGGPIVVPGSQNFVITPIAPHNLNVRPMVIPDNSKIVLRVEGRNNHFLAALDARSESIDPTLKLIVRKANFCLGLVKLPEQNFLNTIRTKLVWGLDKRN